MVSVGFFLEGKRDPSFAILEKRDLLLICLEACRKSSICLRDTNLLFLKSPERSRLNDTCFIALTCLVHAQRRFSLRKAGSEFCYFGKTSFAIDVFREP